MTALQIGTPFAANGLLYVTSRYIADAVRPVYAIRPGAADDISLKTGETSNRYIVWSDAKLGPYNPLSLVYGGYFYTLYDRGFLTCNDAITGKEIYGRKRITAEASGFSASPWAYNGKIFALSEDGDTYVVQAGRELKVLGENSLSGGVTLATPAVAHDSVIIRTETKLYRIAKTEAR